LAAELQIFQDNDALALWAHRRLSAKNTLTVDDARAVERAYQAVLDRNDRAARPITDTLALNVIPGGPDTETTARGGDDDGVPPAPNMVTPIRKPVRRRSKAHLLFVATQPCLICRRTPCDAHHLKFAQPRGLGLKGSDEFVVPLCRHHHQDLHRHVNERAWWSNAQIEPVATAKALWQATLLHPGAASPSERRRDAPHSKAIWET
jgi:hypothetical protein